MAHRSTADAYASEEARWQALIARDARADAHFVYAVCTTGIYARPSAAARLPRRENVRFFDSADAAEAAGYRASRRAGTNRILARRERARRVAQACRLIEAADSPPTLEGLAMQVGVSPFQLHRSFREETGLTPKAYALAHRTRRLREALDSGETTVTAAFYEAGFGSSSRFYESVGQVLGMKASEYRAGGLGMVIRFALGQCSLGAILVAQSQRGLCAIFLGDDPALLVRDLQDRFSRAELIGGDGGFERLVAQVVGFVEAPAHGLNLPLDVSGTAFQQRVWQALREIPAGHTASYAEIAGRIGAPKAARAVAQACAANPLAVAIPCHRVVRQDGDLSGYRWGVERKRTLLRHEAGE